MEMDFYSRNTLKREFTIEMDGKGFYYRNILEKILL